MGNTTFKVFRHFLSSSFFGLSLCILYGMGLTLGMSLSASKVAFARPGSARSGFDQRRFNSGFEDPSIARPRPGSRATVVRGNNGANLRIYDRGGNRWRVRESDGNGHHRWINMQGDRNGVGAAYGIDPNAIRTQPAAPARRRR
jgi:hypothetical protein